MSLRLGLQNLQGAGRPVANLHDPISKSGFIGLQVHGVGNKTNELQVQFRNIRIKELP